MTSHPFLPRHPRWSVVLGVIAAAISACSSPRAQMPPADAAAAAPAATEAPAPVTPRADTPAADPFAGIQQLTGDDLYAAVMAGSPALRARRAGVASAQSRIAQAKAFPEPTVSYQVSPWTLGRGREPGHQAMLSQPLSWPGRIGARAAAASSSADAAAADLGEEERRHLLESRMLFSEYWLADRRIALEEAARALMERTRESALAAVAAGASSADAIEASLAISEIERARLAAVRDRAVKTAEINALTGRAPDAALPPPTVELARVLPLPDQPLLLRLAARRPAVHAAEARERAAESRLRGSHRDRFPDVTVSVGYTSMENRHDEDVFVGAAVTLPLDQGRRRGAIDEAVADLEAARAARSQAVAEANREAIDAYARIDEGAHALALLRERTLPAAQQGVASAQAAYAAGTGTLAVLVRAQRMELALRLMEADELHEYYHQIGNLECCIGVPVQSITVGETRQPEAGAQP